MPEPIEVERSTVQHAIEVERSLLQHGIPARYVSSYFVTTVEGVRFTNTSLSELARVIARKFGWTVTATKARIHVTEREGK